MKRHIRNVRSGIAKETTARNFNSKKLGLADLAPLVLGLLLTLTLCASQAQAATKYNRTWVAHTGNNSNNCSRTAPCATFQGALSKTNSGGEVDAVDSADYGPVAITFPVTIDGGPAGASIGSVASQSACSAAYAAICVAVPKAAGPVVLRNLSINITSTGPNDGVDISSNVVLENVKVTGAFNCIAAGNPAIVDLRDVTLTSCSEDAIYTYGTTVTVDRALITNSGWAVSGLAGGVVYLSDSTIFNNSLGYFQLSGGSLVVSFGNNRLFGMSPPSSIPLQ